MGPGVLRLAGLNSYTGPTCVSGGTLQDIARGAIVHLTMNGSLGTIANGATIADTRRLRQQRRHGRRLGKLCRRADQPRHPTYRQLHLGPELAQPAGHAVDQQHLDQRQRATSSTIVFPRRATIRSAPGRRTMERTSTWTLATSTVAGGRPASPTTSVRLSGWNMITLVASNSGYQFYLNGAPEHFGELGLRRHRRQRPDLCRAVRQPNGPRLWLQRFVRRLQPVRPGAHPHPDRRLVRRPGVHFRRQSADRYSHADCQAARFTTLPARRR